MPFAQLTHLFVAALVDEFIVEAEALDHQKNVRFDICDFFLKPNPVLLERNGFKLVNALDDATRNSSLAFAKLFPKFSEVLEINLIIDRVPWIRIAHVGLVM